MITDIKIHRGPYKRIDAVVEFHSNQKKMMILDKVFASMFWIFLPRIIQNKTKILVLACEIMAKTGQKNKKNLKEIERKQ